MKEESIPAHIADSVPLVGGSRVLAERHRTTGYVAGRAPSPRSSPPTA